MASRWLMADFNDGQSRCHRFRRPFYLPRHAASHSPRCIIARARFRCRFEAVPPPRGWRARRISGVDCLHTRSRLRLPAIRVIVSLRCLSIRRGSRARCLAPDALRELPPLSPLAACVTPSVAKDNERVKRRILLRSIGIDIAGVQCERLPAYAYRHDAHCLRLIEILIASLVLTSTPDAAASRRLLSRLELRFELPRIAYRRAREAAIGFRRHGRDGQDGVYRHIREKNSGDDILPAEAILRFTISHDITEGRI